MIREAVEAIRWAIGNHARLSGAMMCVMTILSTLRRIAAKHCGQVCRDMKASKRLTKSHLAMNTSDGILQDWVH